MARAAELAAALAVADRLHFSPADEKWPPKY